MRQVLILAALVLLTSATAIVPGLGRPLDDEWGDESRGVRVQSTGRDGFQVTSTRSTSIANDTMRVAFEAPGAKLSLGLQAGRPDAVSDFPLVMRLNSVYEFDDLDQDGRLSLGDPITQRFAVMEFGRTDVRQVQSGGDATAFALTYTFRGQAGRTDVTITVPHTGPDDGTPTTTVRMDVTLLGFPLEREGNHTRLGLEFRLDQALATDTDGIADVRDPLVRFLAWDTATIGNGNRSMPGVTVQQFREGNGTRAVALVAGPADSAVTWSFTAGYARLEPRDPVRGFLEDEILGNWPSYLAGLALAGVLILITLSRRAGGPRA